ncbi:MAG: RimK/LysX family protein [Enterovibrio sp.]
MTLRRGVLAGTSLLLASCSYPPLEQMKFEHQQTIATINKTESNLSAQILELKQQLIEQRTLQEQLENNLDKLASQMKKIGTTQNDIRKKIAQPKDQVQYIEKEIPVSIAANKAVLGEIEWVWLDNTQSNFRARVDTGATTSSINATDVQEFERDGKTWVRFNIANHSALAGEPKLTPVEVMVKRWVKIRQSAADELERRPVVELQLRLGNLHEKAQFTLADRSQLTYPLLLGREFFKDLAVVDVSKAYIQPKFVAEAPAKQPQTSAATPAANTSTPTQAKPTL